MGRLLWMRSLGEALRPSASQRCLESTGPPIAKHLPPSMLMVMLGLRHTFGTLLCAPAGQARHRSAIRCACMPPWLASHILPLLLLLLHCLQQVCLLAHVSERCGCLQHITAANVNGWSGGQGDPPASLLSMAVPGLQLLLTVSITALDPKVRILGRRAPACQADFGSLLQVAYIDTEGTFRPERIAPIAARYNLDLPSVLDNVRCAGCLRRGYSAYQFYVLPEP